MLFLVEVKIVDDGEILLKGLLIIFGYLYNKKVIEVLFVDGWFKIGDIGYLDEEGFLFVLECCFDLIILGGENIYFIEIEYVIFEYEGVKEVVVIGKFDDKWGSVFVVFIVVEEIFDEVELWFICEINLVGYKIFK